VRFRGILKDTVIASLAAAVIAVAAGAALGRVAV